MENANEILTRTMLLEKVWDLHFDPQTNIIDVHISRLRKKIDKDYNKSTNRNEDQINKGEEWIHKGNDIEIRIT